MWCVHVPHPQTEGNKWYHGGTTVLIVNLGKYYWSSFTIQSHSGIGTLPLRRTQQRKWANALTMLPHEFIMRTSCVQKVFDILALFSNIRTVDFGLISSLYQIFFLHKVMFKHRIGGLRRKYVVCMVAVLIFFIPVPHVMRTFFFKKDVKVRDSVFTFIINISIKPQFISIDMSDVLIKKNKFMCACKYKHGTEFLKQSRTDMLNSVINYSIT